MEDKNRKVAENEQSACANLIVVMLKGIFYTEKGIPMNSGPVEMGRQNRRTLGVHDCIPNVALPNFMMGERHNFLKLIFHLSQSD